MKCPECGTNLGNAIEVHTKPVEFVFIMQPGGDNRLKRASDITAVEKWSLDHVAPETHTTICPKCSKVIDVTTIVLAPTCVKCGGEFPKMTQPDNLCRYDGLICLGCAKAQAKSICADCSYITRCVLYKRANAK